MRQITPHIAFNDGLGYDGVVYADMVRALRGESDGSLLATRPHFAYRPLPIAIVALSGLELTRGFLAMNVLSFVASGPVLWLLLRRYGVGVAAALIAAVWWSALPGGLRFAIYYPVSVDGIGLFLMIAALAAAAYERVALFALVLAAAVLTRENLILLVPLLWIRLLHLGIWRASALAAAAALPAVAVFAAVRIAPPLAPAARFDLLFEIHQNWDWLLQNAADRAWRFAAAGPATLGLFFALPFIRPRATLGLLRAYPEWAYYLAATVATIIVAGGDYDRYFLYLVPALGVLSFAGLPLGAARLAILTALQLLLSRVWRATGPSEADYLAYNVATMTLDELRALVAVAVATVLAAAIVVRWPARAEPARVEAAPGGRPRPA